MNKMFQTFLEWMYKNFSKDASKMLIFTGVAGWTLSSLAQVGAIIFNNKISNDKKGYLIPQELADAAVNIGSFFLVTLATKKTVAKLFSTGKFACKDVKAFLNKNKELYSKKIGKLDFDLDDVLKVTPEFPRDSYYTSKNFGTTLATIGAGVVSSNIITPIIRNSMATKMQKSYLSAKEQLATNDSVKAPEPSFKSLQMSYNKNSSMRI